MGNIKLQILQKVGKHRSTPADIHRDFGSSPKVVKIISKLEKEGLIKLAKQPLAYVGDQRIEYDGYQLTDKGKYYLKSQSQGIKGFLMNPWVYGIVGAVLAGLAVLAVEKMIK